MTEKKTQEKEAQMEKIEFIRDLLRDCEIPLEVEVIRARITPDLAGFILDNTDVRNRSLGPCRVSKIAEQLKRGKWVFNGETIILDEIGNLLDGQTRLSGCRVSGVPLDSLVVIGQPRNVFPSLDSGSSRGARDVMEIEGYANSQLIAPTIRILRGICGDSGGSLNTEILSVVSEYPGVEDEVCWAKVETGRESAKTHSRRGREISIVPPTIAAAASWVLINNTDSEKKNNRDKVHSFMRKIICGEMVSSTEPAGVLRRQIIKYIGESALSLMRLKDEGRVSTVAAIVKAWNYSEQGKTANFLRLFGDNKVPRAIAK